MGFFTDFLDRWTGADRRARGRVMRQLANSPSISRTRAERMAERLGEELPESHRRWESARSTRLNHAHWAHVTGQPVNAELSAWLNDMRHRSEYEIANNALIEGMIQTYQLCVVGSEGPQLSLLSSDESYVARRAALWHEWAQQAGSNQQLSLVEIINQWIRSLFGSGEFLSQMINVEDVDTPCQMRLLGIHPHRLFTPPEMLGDPEVALGVRRDLRHRRPLSYYVSQPYIMGAFEVYNGQFTEIRYADAIHGFRAIEEDQVRGVPWLVPCLDTAADMRDLKIETLDAARAAADYAVFMSTDHPDAPYIQTNESVAIERRTARNIAPGWKPNMVAPVHPGPQFESFYEALAREIGGPICMPLMMLLLDSSDHNYSSARFDGQMFWRGVGTTQGWLGRHLLRIEAIVAQECELAGELPPPPEDLQRSFIWPLAPHVDPVKEATAERIQLENGTLSYSDACAAKNKRVSAMIATRKRDNDALVSAGLPPLPGIDGQSSAELYAAQDKPEDQAEERGGDPPPQASRRAQRRESLRRVRSRRFRRSSFDRELIHVN